MAIHLCHEIQESAIPDWFLVYPRIKPCSYPKHPKSHYALTRASVIITSRCIIVLYMVDLSSPSSSMLQGRGGPTSVESEVIGLLTTAHD